MPDSLGHVKADTKLLGYSSHNDLNKTFFVYEKGSVSLYHAMLSDFKSCGI